MKKAYVMYEQILASTQWECSVSHTHLSLGTQTLCIGTGGKRVILGLCGVEICYSVIIKIEFLKGVLVFCFYEIGEIEQ